MSCLRRHLARFRALSGADQRTLLAAALWMQLDWLALPSTASLRAPTLFAGAHQRSGMTATIYCVR